MRADVGSSDNHTVLRHHPQGPKAVMISSTGNPRTHTTQAQSQLRCQQVKDILCPTCASGTCQSWLPSVHNTTAAAAAVAVLAQ